MRRNRFVATIALGLLIIALVPVATALGDNSDSGQGRSTEAVTALGSAFTYQGRLTDSGSPANGTYDLRFILFDAETGGAQVGSTQTKDDVTVTNGLFSVELDFGAAAFNGDARWMEIAVRPGSSSAAHTVLSPRQPLSPSPYSLYAKTAGGVAVPFAATGTTAGAPSSTTGLVTITQTGTGIGIAGNRTSTDPAAYPGVLGTNSGGGAGVQGESTFAGGVGVQGFAPSGTAGSFAGQTALNLDGALKVSGTKTAFVHTVDAGATGTTCNPDDRFTILDNPLTNGDQTAILIVTWHGANGSTANPPYVLGVVYNSAECAGAANKWAIFIASNADTNDASGNDSAAFSTGDMVNVLVIKQ
jgi:hypothetical protein